MVSSRRAFFGSSLAWVAGVASVSARRQGGLDQFLLSAPPCTDEAAPTPTVLPDDTFKPGSPHRRSLTTVDTAGAVLRLSGTVAGISCGRIAGARIDFWQADATGRYDTDDFGLRGHLFTDQEGRYQLTTVEPGPSGGRAPHLGVHVNVPNRTELWTELFFPDRPGNANDARFHPALVITNTPSGGLFDFVLDL